MFRKQYEYHMVEQLSGRAVGDIIAMLNVLGSDGWELFAIDYGYFIFKREL